MRECILQYCCHYTFIKITADVFRETTCHCQHDSRHLAPSCSPRSRPTSSIKFNISLRVRASYLFRIILSAAATIRITNTLRRISVYKTYKNCMIIQYLTYNSGFLSFFCCMQENVLSLLLACSLFATTPGKCYSTSKTL